MKHLCCLFAALLALPAAAQDRTGLVTLKDRRHLTGDVVKDDFKEVHIKDPKTGKVTVVKAEEVQLVLYPDAPPGFNTEALAMIESGRFREGLEFIKKAEVVAKEIIEDQTKKPLERKHRGAKVSGAWWPAYSTYYKALCYLNTRSFTQAGDLYDALLKNHKDFRMIREAYEGALRAAVERSEPDWSKAKQIVAAAAADQGRLGDTVLARLEKVQADGLRRAGQFAEAAAMYEKMINSSNEEIALTGLRSMLECKIKQNDAGLPADCDKLIANPKSGAKVRMVASAALGTFLRDKAAASGKLKDFQDAVQRLVDAAVVYYPGRGSGMEADHEETLFVLASCYEGMAQKATLETSKKLYWTMTANTYAEVLAANPNGERAEEAGRKKADAEALTATP